MRDDDSRIAAIPPDRLTHEQAAVLEAVQRGRGFLPMPYRIWLHDAALAARMEALGTYLNTGCSLSEREFEIAIVVVARRLSSPYVLAAHLDALHRTGHPASVIDALRDGREPDFASDRERAVYAIAATAEDAAPASDAVFAHAVEALGRDGLADLLVLIGYYTAVAVAMKLHRVPAGPR